MHNNTMIPVTLELQIHRISSQKLSIELMSQRQESRRFKLVNGVLHTHTRKHTRAYVLVTLTS